MLVAGQLQEPSELLELLANPENDDYFRHRLALAGLCLPEVRTEAYTRPHVELPIDRITSVAFLTWWNTLVNGTEWAARHLTRSIPALAHCNGRVIPERVHAGNGIP